MFGFNAEKSALPVTNLRFFSPNRAKEQRCPQTVRGRKKALVSGPGTLNILAFGDIWITRSPL